MSINQYMRARGAIPSDFGTRGCTSEPMGHHYQPPAKGTCPVCMQRFVLRDSKLPAHIVSGSLPTADYYCDGSYSAPRET